MITIRGFIAGALLAAAGAGAAPGAAQSLFSTRGLGVPLAPVDARAAALGGIGVGLIGFHTSLTNPAELAGVSRRGVSAALQPITTSLELEGVEDGTSGTRFPLMAIIYPVSERLVLSAGYGSYLEQSWGVLTQSTEVIGGQTYTVNDLVRSRGGIAQGRVSAVYSLSPTFAVGAAAGMLTGNVDRGAARSLADTAGTRLNEFSEQLSWRYSAPIGVIGMQLDLLGRVRVGASALIGGELEATPTTDLGEARSYDAPLELSAGASARITPLLIATAGTVWSRMPGTDGDDITRETVRVGGGVEYQGFRSGMRSYPLRLGGQWAQLPYYQTGEVPPTEWSVGGGIGLRIGDPTDPAAVADVGLQRGARSGLGLDTRDDLSESLWRFSISLSLFAR